MRKSYSSFSTIKKAPHKSVRWPSISPLLLYRILPIALVCVIAVCGYSIFDKLISNRVAAAKYEQLAERGAIDDPLRDDYKPTLIDWDSAYGTLDPNGFDPLDLSPLGVVETQRPSSTLTTTEIEKALGYVNRQSEIWALNDGVNSELKAWIYVPGLGINYVVAQEQNNNNYYLNHSFDKSSSYSGTLFMPSSVSINPISKNLIIHGHNMREGTMFATLQNYVRGTRAFYEAHRYVFVDTLYGTYRYQIFSVYSTIAEDIYLQTTFGNNSSFLDWCSKIQAKGMFSSETTFAASDRILTLATCDAQDNKNRIVVHAKLVYPIGTDDIENTSPSPSPTVAPTPLPTPGNEIKVGDTCRILLNDTASTLRLRSQPNTTSEVITNLCHGFQVECLGIENEWMKIKTQGGMQGYILKTYVVSEKSFSWVIPTATIAIPVNTPTPSPSAPVA